MIDHELLLPFMLKCMHKAHVQSTLRGGFVEYSEPVRPLQETGRGSQHIRSGLEFVEKKNINYTAPPYIHLYIGP